MRRENCEKRAVWRERQGGREREGEGGELCGKRTVRREICVEREL